MAESLTLLQGAVLDMFAEGKTRRQIAEATGLKPTEVERMAYELLDSEVVTDVEGRRKLQVYRMERIIEALWQRTMANAGDKDVKNLIDLLDKMNVLLGLNKEQDAELMRRMHDYQFASYIEALKALIVAFKLLAPDLMTEEQWAEFAAKSLEESKTIMLRERELGD